MNDKKSIFCLDQAGIKEGSHTILSHISFNIHERETVVFYGPSGGGKSTLLQLLLGGFMLSGGEYRFQGQLQAIATIHGVRQTIAYIPQQPDFGECTVMECLQQPFSWHSFAGKQLDRAQLQALFDLLGLEHTLLNQICSRLSGGQRQRVAIVRALLTNRQIIIADEPTSALDPDGAEAVIQLLLGGRYTVVSASHDPLWIDACERKINISNGTLVADCPAHQSAMNE